MTIQLKISLVQFKAMLSHALVHKGDVRIKRGKAADPAKTDKRPEQLVQKKLLNIQENNTKSKNAFISIRIRDYGQSISFV